MTSTRQPTKEQVRQYLHQRVLQRSPLPDMQQIRRELGLTLIDARRAGKI